MGSGMFLVYSMECFLQECYGVCCKKCSLSNGAHCSDGPCCNNTSCLVSPLEVSCFFSFLDKLASRVRMSVELLSVLIHIYACQLSDTGNFIELLWTTACVYSLSTFSSSQASSRGCTHTYSLQTRQVTLLTQTNRLNHRTKEEKFCWSLN